MEMLGILSVFIIASVSNGVALSPTELGMMMAVRAYNLVCWYEKLKQFPDTDGDGYTRDCYGKADYVRKYVTDDETGRMYFGDWLKKIAMDGLPSDYRYSCSEYLMNPDKISPVDEGDALNDGQYESYPFQGFSYCLLHTLRNKFGPKALESVKYEKTHKLKHWMTALLERQNEFRNRHGSEPLLLIEELTESAQEWAEKSARECRMQGSRYSDPRRRFNGNTTGETLAAGPLMPSDDAAYLAADSWYEEIKDYPYPAGYRGSGQDSVYSKIAHFTQTVWKDTKYVGYGYAKNEACPDFQYFIVARYSPPGNYVGKFQSNVGFPKPHY